MTTTRRITDGVGVSFTVSDRALTAETLEALEEALSLARDPSVRTYTDTKELLQDLYS